MIRVVDRTPFEPSPLAPRRSPDEQARDRDLGFGSVVSRESRQRLLNRDGSFNVVRSGLSFLEGFAPCHLLLSISWTGFFGVIASYVVINLMFAFAYLACGFDALVAQVIACRSTSAASTRSRNLRKAEIVRPARTIQKTFLSQAVSCIPNLCRLTGNGYLCATDSHLES